MLLKANPANRDEFTTEMLSLVYANNPGMKWIIVLFRMKELHWSEVHVGIVAVLAGGHHIADRIGRHMLTAFEPGPWEFQEHFRYYNRG